MQVPDRVSLRSLQQGGVKKGGGGTESRQRRREAPAPPAVKAVVPAVFVLRGVAVSAAFQGRQRDPATFRDETCL